MIYKNLWKKEKEKPQRITLKAKLKDKTKCREFITNRPPLQNSALTLVQGRLHENRKVL